MNGVYFQGVFRVFSGGVSGYFQDVFKVFFPMPFPGMPFGPRDLGKNWGWGGVKADK